MPTRPRRSVLALAVAAAIALTAAPALAVIKVKMPVARMYGTAKAVILGTVTAVSPANRVVDIAVSSTPKGDSPGQTLRIQVVSPAGLVGRVAADQKMVMFVGKARGGAMAIVHLADTWLLARRAGSTTPQVWRVVQRHNAMQTFPGRTAALARLVGQIKAGKSTIIDEMDVAFFRGGVRRIAKLDVNQPRWIMTADVNGDKKPDLLVGGAGGVRLMLAVADGYQDVTDKWQLRAAAAGYRAAGDVNSDGKVDLLLGKTLWINGGGKFAAAAARLSPASKGRPLAAALADVNGDGRPDALFLTAVGELRVFVNPGRARRRWPPRRARTLWPPAADGQQSPATAEFGDWGDTGKLHVLTVSQGGVTRYALDAAGGPPADFERLTGVNLPRYYQRYRAGLKNVTAAALDVNGDGRRDLLAVCETGGLLLVNRGFGTFLCNYDAGGPVAPHAKVPARLKLTGRTPWTAADLHNDGLDDLLILTADGTLYEVPNKPRPAAGKTPATQKKRQIP